MSEDKSSILELNYGRTELQFVALVEEIESENFGVVAVEYGREVGIVIEGLNCLYAIAGEFAWLLGAPHIAYLNKANTILFSTFHKNLVALHTSLKLTRVGLYGPARSILRHVYEALLIAKYCSVSQDAHIFERWREGDVVYLTNGVLKKIRKPGVDAFKEFWGLMSNYSHATIYAQQIELNIKSAPEEVPLNLVFMRILLDCQYHLLNSHLITPSMRYYNKRYRRDADPLPVYRAKILKLLSESRKDLLALPKEIIHNYRATWELAE